MRKNGVFSFLLLLLIWLVLNEDISLFTAGLGIIFSLACLWLGQVFLPFKKVSEVNFARFALYPIYLLGQIYLAGFNVMKLIVTGGTVEIVEVETHLDSEFLKVMLCHSITLTPGTIFLGIQEDKISVLWFHKKDEQVDDVRETIIGALERKLEKSRRQVV